MAVPSNVLRAEGDAGRRNGRVRPRTYSRGYRPPGTPPTAPLGRTDNDGPRAGASQAAIDAARARAQTGAEAFRGRRAGVALAGGGLDGMPDDGLMDLLFGLPPTGPGSSGNGGGGGGGGGGASGPSQAEKDAYMAMWQAAQDDGAGIWDRYEQTIRGQYDPARIDAKFNTARQGVQTAAQAGYDRLGPIMADLNSRASTARTGANEAFAAGDARLAALQAEYQRAAQGQNAGLNNVLAGFDAGSIAPSGEQNLINLFANSRIANSGARTAYDAGIADRPAIYGGLDADVRSGISRDQTGLENQLAAQQASERSANDAALQQALGAAGVQRMQAEQQRQQDLLKLRADLAAMGITV